MAYHLFAMSTALISVVIWGAQGRGRITFLQAILSMIWLYVAIISVDIMLGKRIDAQVSAGIQGILLWLYFKNGGGKGTKKKLKQWAKKFKGVRRTAPALGN